MRSDTVACSCPWSHSSQHERAAAIELGGAAEFGWLLSSLLSRIDGSRPAPDDFPVGRTELLRFVAFHDWLERAVMVDLMEDLAFTLDYYEKGLHAWPRRLATRAGILAAQARLHVRLLRAWLRFRQPALAPADAPSMPEGAA